MIYSQKLSDISEFIIDCEHKTAPLVEQGIPSVRTTDLKNGRIILELCNRVSEETYKEWTNRLEPQPGDIILSREAPVGEVGIVPPNTKLCLGQRTVLIRLKKDQIDPRFLLYLFLTDEIRHELISRSEGSVVPHLNMSDIRSFSLPELSPLPTQHAVARILGSLDDKIELNRQMNETLEAMARTIFKSWFVDFDPVRAKAEGHDTGLPPEVAALFPDGFEEVDGREVPRGWGVGTIGESTTIVGGSTPSTTNASFWENGTHPFATPKDLAGLSTPILLDTEKKITDLGVDQISSRILPLGTVLLSSRAPIGYIALTKIPVSINQGFIAIICDRALPNYYVLSWVRENLPLIIDRANGTTFLEISKSNFKPMNVLIPPDEVLTKFVQQVEPLYAQIGNNEQQSRTLAQIRDALLPKLMSGEIQIECVT